MTENIPRRDHLAEAKTAKNNVNAIGREAYFANGPTLIEEGQLDALISAAESARLAVLITVYDDFSILRGPGEQRKIITEIRDLLGLTEPEGEAS